VAIVAVWPATSTTRAGWIDPSEGRPNKATPAKMYNDGVDFMPASSSVLFATSSSPLLPSTDRGPIRGRQWGWLPAILWLILACFSSAGAGYTSAVMAMRKRWLTMGV